jgi:hypothetical protein
MHPVLVLRSVVALISVVTLGSAPTTLAQHSTPAASEATREPLVVTTVPAEALPPGPTAPFELWYATIEPGIQVTVPAEMYACCPGPLIEHVLAGELSLRVDGPLRVARAGTDATPGPVEDVPPGTEVVLRPGDSAVSANELPKVYANRGAELVHLVAGALVALVGAGTAGPPGGYEVYDFEELEASLPPGPATLVLERVTLAPEAVLPGPPSVIQRLVITGPDADFLAVQRDGSVRNLNQDEVVAYALSLLPAGAEAGGAPEIPEATPAG